ncbi:MAG: hypothetical protein VKK07_03670 [Merismopediaceae bacterium]|nr:hypothetical protein [Merismopediaceae bacterium]
MGEIKEKEWNEKAQSYSANYPDLNHISACGDTEKEAIPFPP